MHYGLYKMHDPPAVIVSILLHCRVLIDSREKSSVSVESNVLERCHTLH